MWQGHLFINILDKFNHRLTCFNELSRTVNQLVNNSKAKPVVIMCLTKSEHYPKKPVSSTIWKRCTKSFSPACETYTRSIILDKSWSEKEWTIENELASDHRPCIQLVKMERRHDASCWSVQVEWFHSLVRLYTRLLLRLRKSKSSHTSELVQDEAGGLHAVKYVLARDIVDQAHAFFCNANFLSAHCQHQYGC